MAKEMLINVSAGEECRIALLDGDRLEELYMERASSTSHVGNIYKGRVTNVEPSIQAAFIDFGLGRNGFLHISDLMPEYFGRSGEDITESVGRKISRRDRPPIQRCLRRGDDILVQVIKEGIGTKGPTLTTYLSIPGRILVMMPGMSKFGISRKIEDDGERRRLRGILDSFDCPDDVGFIVRTAGIGKSKLDLEKDLKYLLRLWETITKKRKDKGPLELYTEGDLITRTVRDVFTTDVERIIVDDEDVARRLKDFIKLAMPRTKNKVELYQDPIPLFHKYNIEREIELMYSRHVPLPSGGSLVIDQTEAVVAIDVNSGKFRDHADAETTAFRTDMEAADEIPRQLRLRDLGGVIICDFIDLRFERNRRELEQRLHENMRNDRAKTKILRMSQFGIIEMTRQRMRPSLKRSIYTDCPHCKGAGLVKTPESMSLDLMRRIQIAASNERVVRVELSCGTEVATYMLNRNRAPLADMERETGKQIRILPDRNLALDEHKLVLLDTREGLVYLEELGMNPSDANPEAKGPQRPDKNQRGGRRDDRRSNKPNQQPHQRQHHDEDDETDAREEFERGDEPQIDSVETIEDDDAPEPISRGKSPSRPQKAVIADLDVEDQHDESDEEIDEPEESDVIDLDDPHEPIGDAPEGFDDPRDRNFRDNRGGRQRGRRGRGRDNRSDDRPDNRPDNRTDTRDEGRNDNRNAPRGDDRQRNANQQRDNRAPQNDSRQNQPRNRDDGNRDQGNRDQGNRNQQGRNQPNRDGQNRDGQNREGQNRDGRNRDGQNRNQGRNDSQKRPQQNQPPRNQPQRDNRQQRPIDDREPPQPFDGETDELIDEVAPAGNRAEQGPPQGEGEDQPKRRRRRRGGRRHRRRREREAAERAAAEAIARGEPAPPPYVELTDEEEDARDRAEDARDENDGYDSDSRDSDSRDFDSAPPEPVVVSIPEPVAELPVAPEPEPEPEVAPKKTRGKRATKATTAKPKAVKKTAKKATRAKSSKSASAEAAPVVKTGSADKHLADDEPIEFDLPPVAKSFTDLDALPDDFD